MKNALISHYLQNNVQNVFNTQYNISLLSSLESKSYYSTIKSYYYYPKFSTSAASFDSRICAFLINNKNINVSSINISSIRGL